MIDDYEKAYRERLATSKQKCPICGEPVIDMRRYPRYLCFDCVMRAVDHDGRLVSFTDLDTDGGLSMRYQDKASPDVVIESPFSTGFPHVWVDGVECEVRVAHFGGVVIQTTDWREYSSYFTKK